MQTSKMLTRIKENPLFAWMKYSLIGGGIGILCGALLTLFVVEPIKYSLSSDLIYHYHLEPIFSGISFWLPFGLCIGIAQWSTLKQWQVEANGWILATFFGWGLLGTIFGYTIDYLNRQNNLARGHNFTLEAVGVLIGGICIGLFQAIAARKSLPRPGLWILANMLGTLALNVIMLMIMVVPFAMKSYILKFLYAHDLNVLVESRDLLLLSFLIISVPFVAALTLFMPTGKILLKYSVQFSEKEDKVNNKADGESSRSKTG